MRRLPIDLAAVAVLTGIAMLINLVALDDVPLVRLIAALVVTLVAPGYALAAALFPPGALQIPERLLLSVGLSIALVVVGGVVLNAVPDGLQTRWWAVLLGSLTLLACAIAWWRRQAAYRMGVTIGDAHVSLLQASLLGVAAAIGVAAVVVARTPAPPDGLQGYSQLWMLPAADASERTVRLGLTSQEFEATQYRLTVTVDDHVVQEWTSLRLEPGGTWESQVVVPDQVSSTTPLEAALYRLDTPELVYRHVEWWPPSP